MSTACADSAVSKRERDHARVVGDTVGEVGEGSKRIRSTTGVGGKARYENEAWPAVLGNTLGLGEPAIERSGGAV